MKQPWDEDDVLPGICSFVMASSNLCNRTLTCYRQLISGYQLQLVVKTGIAFGFDMELLVDGSRTSMFPLIVASLISMLGRG